MQENPNIGSTVNTHPIRHRASMNAREKIIKMLEGAQMISTENGISNFSTNSKRSKSGGLVYAILDFLKMEEDESVEMYFERNFCSPLDKIIKLVEYEGIEDNGRSGAHVIIELGSTAIPATRVIAGKLRDWYQYDYDNWEPVNTLVPHLMSDLEYYYRQDSSNDYVKRMRKEKKEMLNKLEKMKDQQKIIIDKYAKLPKYSSIQDTYDMRCIIKYIDR